MSLRKKDYYKVEALRILIGPILLWLVTAFFMAQGWVKEENAIVVWNIVIIQTVAALLGVVVVYGIGKK